MLIEAKDEPVELPIDTVLTVDVSVINTTTNFVYNTNYDTIAIYGQNLFQCVLPMLLTRLLDYGF